MNKLLFALILLVFGGCLAGCSSHVKSLGAAGKDPLLHIEALGCKVTVWPWAVEFERDEPDAPVTAPGT